jgi:protein involved in polysaccharide export with SLBB domain
MRRLFPLVVLLALAGCTGQELSPRNVEATGFQPWVDTAPEYLIAPGDKLRVQFLLTPELNETPLVAPDGTIAIRSAGQIPVPVSGLTVQAAQAAVTAASRRVLTNPVVTLGIDEAAGSLVMVGGAVKQPGAYPIPGRRGVLDAVLLARGFEEYARTSQVVLIRRAANNRPMMRTLDLQGYISGTALGEDVPLFAGDIVYVPRSRISEANVWLDQYVNRMMPFNRTFNYSINGVAPIPLQ